ncbi:MAG: hypothetical protein K2F56_05190 [Anaeroplasmataceae bacterium]|nr:hypothetical protein [Anaeroplasmataceae bacterium]
MKKIDAIEKYIERLLNESTPEAPIWNVEILKGRKASWNYIDGCMLSSILELYRLHKEKS